MNQTFGYEVTLTLCVITNTAKNNQNVITCYNIGDKFNITCYNSVKSKVIYINITCYNESL